MVILVRRLLLLSVFAGSHVVFAGENVWTTNGPPGPVTAIAIDPKTLALYAAVRFAPDRDGVFRRPNAAGGWDLLAEAPAFLPISTVAVDPSNSNVYASTNQAPLSGGYVYRSIDNGITWFLIASSQRQNFWSFAFPADDPATLYAGGSSCYCQGFPCFYRTVCYASVLESVDAGLNWRSLGEILAGGRISSVAQDPFDRNRIYAAGDGGIFVTSNGGNHWTAANTGLESCLSVTSLVVDPRDGSVVFIGATWGRGLFECGGVFRSRDGGQTWTPTSLRNRDVTSLVIDPQNPDTLYAGTSFPNPIYADVGVFRSTDGGETWARVGSELPAGVTALLIEPSGRALHAATPTGVYDYEIIPGARPPVVPPRTRGTRTLPARP
jgi:photosystem II stability/assembly factor-like uncharacterized protein